MDTLLSGQTSVRRLSYLSIFLSVSVLIISSTMLILWLSGYNALRSSTLTRVPMAPLTATLFLVVAAVQVYFHFFGYNEDTRVIYLLRVIVSITGIVSFYLMIRFLLSAGSPFYFDFEKIFVPKILSDQGYVSGRTSPITAVLFFVVALYLFVYMYKSRSHRLKFLLSNGLATAVLVAAFVIVIGYLFDTPLFYGGTLIPVALLTGLCFLFVSFSFILDYPGNLIIRFISSDSVSGQINRAIIPIAVIFVLLFGRLALMLHNNSSYVTWTTVTAIGALLVSGAIGVLVYFSARRIQSGIDQYNEERKRAEAIIASSQQEKMDELESIIYVTSHDLRTPLVNIQGFSGELGSDLNELSRMLKGKGAETEPEHFDALVRDIRESLKYISVSTEKIDSLLRGLLMISRIGRNAIVPAEIDMDQLISTVLAVVEFQTKQMGITIKADDLPRCLADNTQTNQLFSNIIDNAIKYRDPDRPEIIRIRGQKEGSDVVYSVEDNGIGIRRQDYEIIFNIFRRLNPDASPGEGMGLAIVQRIAQRNHGRVWVESEPGRGSTFFVALPAA